MLATPTSNTIFLTGLGQGEQVFLAVEPVCPNGEGKLSKEVAASSSEQEGSASDMIIQGGCSLPGATGRVSLSPAVLLLLALLGLVARRRR